MNLPALRLSPYLLLVLTMLFWSGNFVLGRAVRALMPPIALSFWRWAIALLLLLPLAWPRLRMRRSLLKRHWQSLTLLSILGVVNFNTFVYTGLQSTTAINAVMMISATPVIIIALSFFLLRQTVTRWQALGIAVSLLGVLVIVTRGEPRLLLEQHLNKGDLWVLAAVLSWALYSVCLHWRPAGLDPLSFLATTVGMGVMFLLPLYGWNSAQGAAFQPSIVTLGSIAYVALFPSVVAYIFWNRAVAELGANRAGQFMHLMPAFGAIESMLFLGERLYAFHGIGIGLIALGIYLATAFRTHRPEAVVSRRPE